MIKIETSRLTLQLLTLEQAELYFLGNNFLEQHLHLPNADRIVDPHFREVAENIFLPNLRKDKENIIFYSFYILIEKSTQNIVGEIGCHGRPNENGEVEIGYSTQAHFQNKGFMSEAVGAFATFLLTLDNVKMVTAETEKINIPSEKVLINNHFILEKETETNRFWKLNS